MGNFASTPKYAVSLPLRRAYGSLAPYAEKFTGKGGCDKLDFLYRILEENDGALRPTQELVIEAKKQALTKFGEGHAVCKGLDIIKVESLPTSDKLTAEEIERLVSFASSGSSSSGFTGKQMACAGAGVAVTAATVFSCFMLGFDGCATPVATAAAVAPPVAKSTATVASLIAGKPTVAALITGAAL